MKKRTTFLFCSLMLTSLLVITGCDKPHVHSFSTTFSSNETEHWHECECGEKSGLAPHSFDNKETIDPTNDTPGKTILTCSVCAYTHTSPLFKAPSAPTAFTSQSSNQEVVLTWEAPLNNGGMPIDNYEVKINDHVWVDAKSHTSHTFDNLTNGLEYRFYVRAYNECGPGEVAQVTATPVTTPSAPGITVNPELHDGALLLIWSAPSDDGGSPILGYKVNVSPGSEEWINLPEETDRYYFENLTGGAKYTFSVRAYNAFGDGLIASIERTAISSPSLPQDLTAIPSWGCVDYYWNPPENDGGRAVEDYVIKDQAPEDVGTIFDAKSLETDEPGFTYHSRKYGSYGEEIYFGVTAVNSLGESEVASIRARAGQDLAYFISHLQDGLGNISVKLSSEVTETANGNVRTRFNHGLYTVDGDLSYSYLDSQVLLNNVEESRTFVEQYQRVHDDTGFHRARRESSISFQDLETLPFVYKGLYAGSSNTLQASDASFYKLVTVSDFSFLNDEYYLKNNVINYETPSSLSYVEEFNVKLIGNRYDISSKFCTYTYTDATREVLYSSYVRIVNFSVIFGIASLVWPLEQP